MVWYADGSIEVATNGQLATGTGTAFLKNVRIGDGLTIAGSASMHEVTNIASDTQLTFSPPYTGAAGAGKQYRIAPIQGYVKEAADRLREVLREVGPLIMSEALQALAEAQTDQERRAAVGLGKVDNTADVDKPISKPVAAALASPEQKNADLVTQAEAEAGTGTAIRSWPVARVWQASAAWWNQSGMKTKLDGLQKTGNTTDSSQGALLKVGDFGLGRFLDLRGSILVTGKPSDVFSRGFLNGLADGGELGVPGLSAADYGVFTISSQWADASSGQAVIKRFSAGNREWVQYSLTADTWSAWTPVITSRTAVGVVSSDSSGVPTGAIIEKGSNANGRYIKFSDGTLLCYGSSSLQLAANTYNEITWTFPHSFTSTAYYLDGSAQPLIMGDFYGSNYTINDSQNSGRISFRNGATGQNLSIKMFAFGLWR